MSGDDLLRSLEAWRRSLTTVRCTRCFRWICRGYPKDGRFVPHDWRRLDRGLLRYRPGGVLELICECGQVTAVDASGTPM